MDSQVIAGKIVGVGVGLTLLEGELEVTDLDGRYVTPVCAARRPGPRFPGAAW